MITKLKSWKFILIFSLIALCVTSCISLASPEEIAADAEAIASANNLEGNQREKFIETFTTAYKNHLIYCDKDELEGNFFIMPEHFRNQIFDNDYAYVYIGTNKDGNVWTRFTGAYYASNWIFMDKIKLYAPNKDITISVNADRHVLYGGDILEKFDILSDERINSTVSSIAKDGGTYRFIGDYYSNLELSEKQKEAQSMIFTLLEILTQ